MLECLERTWDSIRDGCITEVFEGWSRARMLRSSGVNGEEMVVKAMNGEPNRLIRISSE